MENSLADQLAELRKEVESLRRQINTIESTPISDELPQTALLDHGFLKRSFAVFGHNFVASLIVSIPIYLLMFLFMLVIGFGD